MLPLLNKNIALNSFRQKKKQKKKNKPRVVKSQLALQTGKALYGTAKTPESCRDTGHAEIQVMQRYSK